MDPPLPSLFKGKMLHRVCQINIRSIHPGFRQRAIQNLSCRPDKRPPGAIFRISRLFADQHNARVTKSFAKHRLRRMLKQLASFASLDRFTQLAQISTRRNKRSSSWHLFLHGDHLPPPVPTPAKISSLAAISM